MSKIAPSNQDALELALLNRNVAPGFNFGWRSTSRTGVFVLEDSRNGPTVVYTSPSPRILHDIYTNFVNGVIEPGAPLVTGQETQETPVQILERMDSTAAHLEQSLGAYYFSLFNPS